MDRLHLDSARHKRHIGRPMNKTQLGLVDQCRRLPRPPRVLRGHLLRGQPAQFVVPQRQQLGRSLSITARNR